jgi:hypothetical protein
MSDTARMVLIALGAALIVAVLLPLLFMGGMMGTMMGGVMGGDCCGGSAWIAGGLTLLALVAGGVLLVLGLRR